jgi:putative oxidoreductase
MFDFDGSGNGPSSNDEEANMDIRRRRRSKSDPDVSRLLLRGSIGGFFIGHGTQKLLGWFGGHGLDGTGQFFESVGLRPGRRQALAAGIGESVGGALLAAGLATPLAAASLVGVMLTAIRKVHAKNGPWVSDGGYEYNAVLITAVVALAELGPGRWSADALLGTEKKGTRWALAALAAGSLGSLLATGLGARHTSATPAEDYDAEAADLPISAEADEEPTPPVRVQD